MKPPRVQPSPGQSMIVSLHDVEHELGRRLKAVGVDLIDASSGGTLPHRRVHAYPGYRVPFARAIRELAWLGAHGGGEDAGI